MRLPGVYTRSLSGSSMLLLFINLFIYLFFMLKTNCWAELAQFANSLKEIISQT